MRHHDCNNENSTSYHRYTFCFRRESPQWVRASSFMKFSRSHTTTHHTPKDSSGRMISPTQRPLPDNIQHSQQTSMPPMGIEPTISAGERPQTYALDRAATGTGTGTRGIWSHIQKTHICLKDFPLVRFSE